MRFKTLAGRSKNTEPRDYLIDWEAGSRSRFQGRVKEFLQHYWDKPGHLVCEEFPVAGTRMTLDFYHVGKRIAIECDGEQHLEYNKHFHKDSFSLFQKQLQRDTDKKEWCDLNTIQLVRIYEEDVPNLDLKFFQKLGVNL